MKRHVRGESPGHDTNDPRKMQSRLDSTDGRSPELGERKGGV